MTDNAEKILYLIDGHAQIFRAYFAIRGGMTSPVTGEPTHAVFGYAGMLIKLFDKFHPAYVITALDSPGKTFRDEIYPEYKAQREAPPEDFRPQVERIIEMTRLFGIPTLAQEGAEADDIIATCVRRILDDPAHKDVRIRIVSKDKDLEQLLGPRVEMFDIHKDQRIDLDALRENRGITPQQVIDLLALTGDKVDNIPGVPGIGPKTAAQLLQQFGSIEGIYEHLDEIKGKRRENLEAARELLPMSRTLVTLKDDVPVDFTMEKAHVGGVQATALKRFLHEMGFRRHEADVDHLLAKGAAARADQTDIGDKANQANTAGGFGTLFDLGDDAPTDSDVVDTRSDLKTAAGCEYVAVTTRDALDQLVADLRAAPIICVDTETIGLGSRAQVCGLSFAWREGHGVYVPISSPTPEKHLDRDTVLGALRPVLEDEAIAKCGHNIKYDMLVLLEAGVDLRGEIFDTMVAAALLNKPGQGLDYLALSELRHEVISITSLIGPRKDASGRRVPQKRMDQVSLELVTPYAAEDADIALRLYEKFRPELEAWDMTRLAREVEMPLVRVLADMQRVGIRIEPSVLAEQKQALGQDLVELRQQVYDLAGCEFSLDSPKQLADVLFKRMGLPVIKRGKTGPSTDVEVLERLAGMEGEIDAQKIKVPRLIVEYRQRTKLLSTYLDNLRESIHEDTGRIHASFHQTGTATGRLSSSGPNLQNIPVRTDMGRQIRKAFVADAGCRLISADYSQIELRMLAHLSEDAGLLDAFHNDLDIHAAVAAQVFGVAVDDVSSEQRARAKVINFGIIYGITAFGLARRIEGLGRTEAQALIDSYRQRFPGIDAFMQRCVAHAQEHGHVTTILGRRRNIEQFASSDAQQNALGQRLAINTVVQGSAADLIKLAMVNLHARARRESLPMSLLLQIHDELVVEAPAAEAQAMADIVTAEMENAMTLKVPLKVEAGIGDNWLDAK